MYLHLITKGVAKANGLKRYFTGNPCIYGGIGERRVSTGGCLCIICKENELERDRKRYQENIEVYRERRRSYQQNNQGKVAEYQRRYYEENRERIAERDLLYRERTREAAAKRSRDYYAGNLEKCRESQRAYREKNREKIVEIDRRYREENREKIAESGRRWRQDNKEAKAERDRKYREKNQEAIAERLRRYRKENQEKFRERDRIYQQENPHIKRKAHAKRRATKRNAVPSWYGELDDFVLDEATKLCDMRKQATGFDWHVDHMIPLQARNVCGLHVWNNLQVIPAYVNLSKCNKLIYTQPVEWLVALL